MAATCQGPDGTGRPGPVEEDRDVLGVWNLWRAGYRLVNFFHDQAVVEVPEDDRVEERRREVIALMCRGMLEVVPGMRVQVEAGVTRSLNKTEVIETP
jgi:hypothetical protein